MKIKLNLRVLILFFLISLSSNAQGQVNDDPWATLALVEKESKFDDLMGMIVETARPLPPASALDGQEMEIRGYIIALAAKSKLKHFMFSRYPQNMCFFCGAAGPESAMQVFLKSGKTIDYTSDKVVIKGTLSIQAGDPSGLIYTLSNAELIDVIKQ